MLEDGWFGLRLSPWGERIREEQTRARSLLFRDFVDSKGEEVCIGDYPTLGIFNAEVLYDPKIRYIHPNYRLLRPKTLGEIVREESSKKPHIVYGWDELRTHLQVGRFRSFICCIQ